MSEDRRVFVITDALGVQFDVVGWTDAWARFTDLLARTSQSGSFEMRLRMPDGFTRPLVAECWLARPGDPE